MIKAVTDSLQRQYDTFIDEPDDWFFFLGLAEYMQYLRTTELTTPLIEGVEAQMHQFDDEFKKIHEAIEDGAKRAFEVIQGRIAEEGIKDEVIERETNEYHGFLDGTWSSTASLGQSLYRNVRNIVERLRNLDRDDLVKEYFVPFKPDPKLTEIYTIAPSRDRLDDLEKKQEQSKKTQIWGSYWHLERARWAIMDGLDYMNRQKGTLRGSLNRINASPLIREMAAMERRDPNPQLERFIKRDYLFHARRFHTFVLNTLAKVPKYLLDDQENKVLTMFSLHTATAQSTSAESQSKLQSGCIHSKIVSC